MIILWFRSAEPIAGPIPISIPPSPVTMMKVTLSEPSISPRRFRSQNASTTPATVAAPFWNRLWMNVCLCEV
ncbi:hypothetical protein D3C84_1245640 [compost metagenome]